MTKNILIAGGTGMIGSACLRLCSKSDDHHIFAPPRSELDVTDRQNLLSYLIVHRIKHVIYAVGMVGGIIENRDNPARLIDANALMGLNGVWAAQQAGVEKMILFGSSCMFPVNASQPFDESSILTGPIEQTSIAYATAKILTMQAASANNRQFPQGTKFISVIPNSTYGPKDDFDPMKSHVMAALIGKIHHAKIEHKLNLELWGSGEPLREFVYADDVAKVVQFLLTAQIPEAMDTINIASGAEISIRDLANVIAGVIGYVGKITFDASKPDGVMRKALSNKRLASLGWSEFTDLKDGIMQTYDWYKYENS